MHAVILVQVPALQQAKLAKARAEEAEAARRAKAQEITRRKEATKVAKVRLAGLRPLLPPLFLLPFLQNGPQQVDRLYCVWTAAEWSRFRLPAVTTSVSGDAVLLCGHRRRRRRLSRRVQLKTPATSSSSGASPILIDAPKTCLCGCLESAAGAAPRAHPAFGMSQLWNV